ncbi:MAG TPA: hypothetical protein VM487_15625 [Phycisphaerae bacterium]|nr:hypothetical protein [Phycisphaerae bacterium]
MALNEGDKAIIKEAVWDVISEHIKTCPVRSELRLELKVAWYRLIIAGIITGSLGGGVAKLLSLF